LQEIYSNKTSVAFTIYDSTESARQRIVWGSNSADPQICRSSWPSTVYKLVVDSYGRRE